jgi:hypothetical protein
MADDSAFVFRFQPAGPNTASHVCLVLAPDEAAAESIMREAADDGLEFTLCTDGELSLRPGLLQELRQNSPTGIGPYVKEGLKLKRISSPTCGKSS